jgi:hypothetical protein
LPHVPPATFELELQHERTAGQMPKVEALAQARELAAQHEKQRLAAVDRSLEIDRLFNLVVDGRGERCPRLFPSRERRESKHLRAQTPGQGAARQPQQIAYAVHAEAGELLRELVVGIEQIDPERREEVLLRARR